jgi:hypothetical protein
MNKRKLIQLYRDIAEHTRSACKRTCKFEGRCVDCSDLYGAQAEQFMLTFWKEIPPQHTGSDRCRFLGADGCILAPHFRPICSIHHCSINSLGFLPGDPGWTKRYFRIRERVDQMQDLDCIVEM